MVRTRNAIMQAFEALLGEKPITKITVTDITERCGITRNTFYYHFKDIPTLMQQLMEEKVDRLIAQEYVPDSPMDCVRPSVEYMLRQKKAVLHMYCYVPRENMQQLLTRASGYLVNRYFEKIASEHPDVPKERIELLAYFFQCTVVGMLLNWLDAGMPESILETAEKICILLEGTTQQVLEGK